VGLLFARDFATLLAVFVAVNVCHGSLMPMVDAIVVDHLDELGGDYGRLRLWGSASFIVGAAGSAPLVHAWGPGVVPILLVLPQLALAPVLARLPHGQRGHAEHAGAPWTLITPAFAALLAAVFLANASSGAWSGFFALHVRALGLSDSLPGLAFALAVVVEIVLFHAGRRVLLWMAPADLVVIALAVTVVRWAASAIVTSEAAVLLVQLGHVFTYSMLHLASVALIIRLVPDANATSGQALYGGIGYGLGGAVGIALAGLLVDRLGTVRLFWFEAAIALVGLVPAWRLRRMRV
jgi:PPP family 3-phenylpropionic acid transporter